ncbi:50S ribosomal protein L4 [Puniceicoccales bacterium CK1056]|uniref:Large ribosomal subunit protein uL4 n=1 Tax=Oceanipulchritudo coccoides TaxID=2706888 RepID=A0A6B2M3G6_9BACT|nr:50S ribosomal protein L4 [Oceanipulchritudo coccoides]NDV62644.1 50S ribosomal protein L4 [Oceanipulchritudo coccoides]
MKLKVFSSDGGSSSEKEYAIPQFDGEKGLQALKQVILAVMANRRQGTVSTKTRSTVHGTGKKPFRQKGSGTARQGSKVAPQHYHGSVAHGPQPRDFSQRINKKMRHAALSRALFDRAVDGEVVVIEKWEVADRKTRLFNEVLEKVAPKGRLLILDDSWSDQSLLAARNINRIEVNEASDVNAYDLSAYDQVIFSEKGLERLLTRLNGGN